MASRESSSDRQKIIRISILHVILYFIFVLFEMISYFEGVKYLEWFGDCTKVAFLTLVDLIVRIAQHLCLVIFSIVILCYLNSYKKAIKSLRSKFSGVFNYVKSDQTETTYMTNV
jgi:hypothetical protein